MLKRNEAGIAVPDDETPLPWKVERDERISDRCGMKVDSDSDGFPDTLHFIAHAANYYERLADIVRRLAETPTSMGQTFYAGYTSQLISEAKTLLESMRKDGE
jgi:hypothetical protein